MALEERIVDRAELEAARRAAEAEVFMAAETFGSTLRATPEFTRLVLAGDALFADADANAAISAFRTRQDELRMAATLGTLSEHEATELRELHAQMLGCTSVATYVEAQAGFEAICRETAAVVSGQIDLDFAANCRAGGCCG